MATSTPGAARDSYDSEQWRSEFLASSYGIVKSAISLDMASTGVRYMQIMRDYYTPLLYFDEEQQSYGRYNDPFGESVLATLAPKVAALTGLDLLPTYSYSRIYAHGGVLHRHIDRPSCEVSGTLLLGSDVPWPIGIEVDGEERDVHLEPGDMMLYRGCDIPHWRKAFTGQYSAHIFLHFVEASGPYGGLIYDERPALGAPQTRRAPQRNDPNSLRRPGAVAAGGNGTGVRVHRNEPCPCGSGKRYKNCHGAWK